VVARRLTNPGRAAWSPDGTRLALTMTPPDGPRGLYLIDVRTGKATLVLEHDRLGGVTWTGADALVAAVGVYAHLEGDDDSEIGLYRIRLPNVGGGR
jgi:dipeptidyl aminopeptidase/acylaminoacyl peptidase